MMEVKQTPRAYAHRDRPSFHDAPEGFAWTDEYRVPQEGDEYVLSVDGLVTPAYKGGRRLHTVTSPYGNTGLERHILRKLQETHIFQVTLEVTEENFPTMVEECFSKGRISWLSGATAIVAEYTHKKEYR
jgi:hypothetical protein